MSLRITVVFILLPALLLGQAGETIDLYEAIRQDKVSVSVTGESIRQVNGRVTRKAGSKPMIVKIPLGTLFDPGSAGFQNMVTTQTLALDLRRRRAATFSAPVVCANMSRPIPGRNVSFSVRPAPHQAELLSALPVLERAGVGFASLQAATWVLTDNADYEDLGTLRTTYSSFGGSGRTISEGDVADAAMHLYRAGINLRQRAIWRDMRRVCAEVEKDSGFAPQAALKWCRDIYSYRGDIDQDLSAAAMKGAEEQVQRLLTRGANPNGLLDGEPPLFAAAAGGHTAIARHLLRAGARVNTADQLGRNALMMAVANDRVETVRTLLLSGSKVNSRISLGMTPLLLAAIRGNLPVVRALLTGGAQVSTGWKYEPVSLSSARLDEVTTGSLAKLADNSSAVEGLTPLMAASAQGHGEVVAELLARGAEVNAQTRSGLTALMAATAKGDLRIVRELLSRRADPNVVTDVGETALHLAASQGTPGVVTALLTAGAKVDARDKEGISPLGWAAAGGHADIVKALLARAIPRATDLDGALLAAIDKGSHAVMKVLLQSGADALAKSQAAATGLRTLVHRGDVEGVSIMLESGAPHNDAGDDGQTPLISAVFGGHSQVVELLLEKGADPNDSIRSHSVLMIAAGRGDNLVIRALLAKGASGPNALVGVTLHDFQEVNSPGRANPTENDKPAEPINYGPKAIKALLANGVSPSAPDDKGRTALHSAAGIGRIENVQALLEGGADANTADSLQRTALHIASERGDAELIQLLLRHGSKPRRVDSSGENAYHLAAKSGSAAALRELLRAAGLINDRGFANATEQEITVSYGRKVKSFRITDLQRRHVANESLEKNRPFVLLCDPETSAVGVFSSLLENMRLNLRRMGTSIKDQETGSTWSVVGLAVDGPLKGTRLQFLEDAWK
jgi:ankyrin repeat protein